MIPRRHLACDYPLKSVIDGRGHRSQRLPDDSHLGQAGAQEPLHRAPKRRTPRCRFDRPEGEECEEHLRWGLAPDHQQVWERPTLADELFEKPTPPDSGRHRAVDEDQVVRSASLEGRNLLEARQDSPHELIPLYEGRLAPRQGPWNGRNYSMEQPDAGGLDPGEELSGSSEEAGAGGLSSRIVPGRRERPRKADRERRRLAESKQSGQGAAGIEKDRHALLVHRRSNGERPPCALGAAAQEWGSGSRGDASLEPEHEGNIRPTPDQNHARVLRAASKELRSAVGECPDQRGGESARTTETRTGDVPVEQPSPRVRSTANVLERRSRYRRSVDQVDLCGGAALEQRLDYPRFGCRERTHRAPPC